MENESPLHSGVGKKKNTDLSSVQGGFTITALKLQRENRIKGHRAARGNLEQNLDIFRVASYARVHSEFNEKIFGELEKLGFSSGIQIALGKWLGKHNASRKPYRLTAYQFAAMADCSVGYAFRTLKKVLELGIVKIARKGNRGLKKATEYIFSGSLPRWGERETIEPLESQVTKKSLFSLLSEEKKGNPPTPLEAQPALEVPPEPKKEGFAWSDESREEIRKAVSLLVSCGVSTLGAKKAVNAAFSEKRLDLAMEDLQVAQVWMQSQPWIRNQAGWLQALVGKEANHLHFRDSLLKKSKPLSPAAGSVTRERGPNPTTANGTTRAAYQAWQSLEIQKSHDGPVDLDREHAIGLSKERFTRVALSELGERGREIEADVLQKVGAAGLSSGLATKRAIDYHLNAKVLQELRINA
jgi:hypothetical protein